jgi:hypothetical protein
MATSLTSESIDSPVDTTPQAQAQRRVLLPWVLAALGVSAAAVFAFLWLTATAAGQARDLLRAEARGFVLALTNFSSATIERDVEEIRAFATGGFADEVETLFSNEVVAAIKDAKATSEARVESIFVQELDGDDASVFAVLTEKVDNRTLDSPRRGVVRMEVGLIHTGEAWKVDRVELFQSPGEGTLGG